MQKWGRDQDNWELYNMETDCTEIKNLILDMPEKAYEMIYLYNNWTTKIKVLPWTEVLSIMEEKNKECKHIKAYR